jgi:hypothetical protein
MVMYVGLDVHSQSSVCVIQEVDGKLVGGGEVPTSREGFERVCSQYGLPRGTKAALETGTVAFFAARELSRGPRSGGALSSFHGLDALRSSPARSVPAKRIWRLRSASKRPSFPAGIRLNVVYPGVTMPSSEEEFGDLSMWAPR